MKTDSIYTDTIHAVTPVHNAAISWLSGDLQVWRIIGIIVLAAIGISFILAVIKLLLDHRLKSKLLQKELPEDQIRLILGSGRQPLKEIALKWSLTSVGVAAGLFIAGLTETGPAMSMAFIAACIAASFGFYYLITKK
ncbi:MAG: hypothetical protein JSU01_11805 [Bacteroidetes bacterium]|nr:hypothetical protein [Bacteroidota bacterium]